MLFWIYNFSAQVQFFYSNNGWLYTKFQLHGQIYESPQLYVKDVIQFSTWNQSHHLDWFIHVCPLDLHAPNIWLVKNPLLPLLWIMLIIDMVLLKRSWTTNNYENRTSNLFFPQQGQLPIRKVHTHLALIMAYYSTFLFPFELFSCHLSVWKCPQSTHPLAVWFKLPFLLLRPRNKFKT